MKSCLLHEGFGEKEGGRIGRYKPGLVDSAFCKRGAFTCSCGGPLPWAEGGVSDRKNPTTVNEKHSDEGSSSASGPKSSSYKGKEVQASVADWGTTSCFPFGREECRA